MKGTKEKPVMVKSDKPPRITIVRRADAIGYIEKLDIKENYFKEK